MAGQYSRAPAGSTRAKDLLAHPAKTGVIGSSSKIQASRGRGLVAVAGRQGRSASLPAAARDVHVPVRPARRRAGAGRPRRGELPAALRALVFGPPALLAAAAGADRPD